MWCLKVVYVWALLLVQLKANTITQFIKPGKEDSYLKEVRVTDADININFIYNHTKQINDFTYYVDMSTFSSMNNKLAFEFESVPVYKDNEILNSFFNKISWSPASGVDLDNLAYSIDKKDNIVSISLDVISLSKYVDGFYIYISLEELSYFGILPWSIVSMIKFLTYSIGSILIVLLLATRFFWNKYSKSTKPKVD